MWVMPTPPPRGYGVAGWRNGIGKGVKVIGPVDWVMTMNMVVVNAFFRLFLISNG